MNIQTESLVVILPLSVRRGEAPFILEELMDKCQLTLVKFRSWAICNNTWRALLPTTVPEIHFSGYNSWACLFRDRDELVDPTERINTYCGPMDMTKWRSAHLRYRRGSYANLGVHASPEDLVVHVADPARLDLEKSLVFKG